MTAPGIGRLKVQEAVFFYEGVYKNMLLMQ